MMLIASLLYLATCCATGGVVPLPREPVIVSAAWLAQHASERNVVVLAVLHSEEEFERGHIPGVRFIAYGDITTTRNGLMTELPDAARLRQIFESAGVTDDSRVIVYSDMPLMASRAFFSLEFLGQRHAAILDGGLETWQAQGGGLVTDTPVIRQGKLTTHERPELIADAAWIRSHLESPHVALVDTRSDVEYRGAGERHGMPSLGHIPGARQLQWQELFADPDEGVFRDAEQLANIFRARAARGDTVVTYCYVGYRASMTYLVARALGYEAKLYDGSYQDWARRSLPLTTGDRP
jgi:thiosulfate/3-mercaptopyruvate sulfurtransferase